MEFVAEDIEQNREGNENQDIPAESQDITTESQRLGHEDGKDDAQEHDIYQPLQPSDESAEPNAAPSDEVVEPNAGPSDEFGECPAEPSGEFVDGLDDEVAKATASMHHARIVTPGKSAEKQRRPSTRSSVSAGDGFSPSPRKVASPSEHLLRTTKARVNDLQELENQRRAKDARNFRVAHASYQPSERLLRTTQSRIADIKEWEARRDRVNYDDDIWWELRRPTPASNHRPDVPSKLHAPTEAYMRSTRPKKGKELPATPPKETTTIAKIDPSSPLLKATRNHQLSTWKAEKPSSPAPSLKLATAHTGPQVNSKIMEQTTATLLAQWRSKSAEKTNDSPTKTSNGGMTVKSPSARLLSFNAAMRNQSRDKLQKPSVDPRERGWNLNNLSKEGIPPVEVCFGPAGRRSLSGSRSPTRRCSLSSSRSSTLEAEQLQAMNEAVAQFDENQDLPMSVEQPESQS